MVSKAATMVKHTNATGLTSDTWHPGMRRINVRLGGRANAERVVNHSKTKSPFIRNEVEKTPSTRNRNREEFKIKANASIQAIPRIIRSHSAPVVTAETELG